MDDEDLDCSIINNSVVNSSLGRSPPSAHYSSSHLNNNDYYSYVNPSPDKSFSTIGDRSMRAEDLEMTREEPDESLEIITAGVRDDHDLNSKIQQESTKTHVQELDRSVHAQDIDRSVHVQDIDRSVHGQDLDRSVHGQKLDKSVHAQELDRSVHSMASTSRTLEKFAAETAAPQDIYMRFVLYTILDLGLLLSLIYDMYQ